MCRKQSRLRESELKKTGRAKASKEPINMKEMKRVDHILALMQKKVDT